MNKFQIFSLTLILTLASAAGHAQPADYIFRSSFEGNFVPDILEIDVLGGIATENFSHQLQTVPGSPRVDVWSIVSGPAGLTVDPLTGMLTWLPGFPDVGDHRVVVTAATDTKDADTEGFDIHILHKNSPPVIGNIADQGVVADTLFSFAIPASDPDTGDVLDYGLITGPAGMTMGALSGILAWTPSMADIGDHAVTVSVTDPAGVSDNASLLVSVYAANTPPVLSAVGNQGAQMGETFNILLDATDDDGDTLAYALTQRPAGMSINTQSGAISWTPLATAQGQAMVTAEVRDGKGGTDSESFLIAVDQNYAPVAVDDHYSVERGETLMVPSPGVLDNDLDINFDPLTAQLVNDVNAGVLSLQSDGSFEYTPDNTASPLGFVEKFTVPSPYGGPTSITTIADMDGDGFSDLVLGFSTGVANRHKTLVVRGDTGDVIYESPEYERSLHTGTGTSVLADIDLDGRLEMIAIGGENGRAETQLGHKLIAMEHDGTFKWISDPLPDKGIYADQLVVQNDFRHNEIAIADLDQDGTPEIIVGTSQRGGASNGIGVVVFDNQGKHLFTRYARASFQDVNDDARPEIIDLDLDGDPEILIQSAAFSHTGEPLWQRTDLFNRTIRATPIAVNLDNDPYPELVRAKDDNEIIALNHDGSTAWVATTGLGMAIPLLAADVDDDGFVDVISASSSRTSAGGRVEVLNGIDGTSKWQYPPADEPNLELFRTSPVVLDLDRDGSTEVLVFTRYRDIHVLNGSDGSLINIWDLGIGQASAENTPIFADVDQDGASELVLSGTFSFGVSPLVWVFEAPNDDWLPTGSIWNQVGFHVTNINPDGTVPQFEQPHWLIPGLNQNHLNGLLPEERVATTDAFTYLANDGEFDSNIATVNIDVLPPNNPPQILSSPRLLASPGFEYFYPMLVVDADVGETLTYQLVDGPVGMSVDASGQITWTPAAGDLGEHPVVVTVTDSFGYSDTQYFSVKVQSPSTVPDVLGLTESNAIDSLEALDLSAGPILEIYSNVVTAGQVATQDPVSGTVVAAGTQIGLEVSVGPAPVPVPRLVSLDLDSALAAINNAGLSVGNLVYINSQELPTGGILQQSPPPNADAAPGSAVDLVVSGGPRFVIQVSPAVIPSGENAVVEATVYTNEGLAESPQPVIDLSIEYVPDHTSGPLPVIAGGSLTTSATTAGEFTLRASINGGSETRAVPFVVLPPIADGDLGTIYTDFALQLETFSQLTKELQAAITANDNPAIVSLDLQLQALAADIDLKQLRGTTPMAPEGGVPPDPDTALGMGFLPEAQDDAYLQSATALAATLDDMRVLLDDNNAPDVFMQTLNQQLMQQANALVQIEPSTHGVLTANGVLVNMLSARIPELVVADINALHTALVDAGVVNAGAGLLGDTGLQGVSEYSMQPGAGQPISKGRQRLDFFSLPSVMGAVGIRNQIINDIYFPIIGDLVSASLLLVVRDGLVAYANAGHLYGIVTASSQSIHVFDVAGSFAEGEGFELYAPANTTIMISPQKIREAIEILESIPDAEDLKAINEIAGQLKALAESLVSEPQDVLRGCFLDTSPTCKQLIYDKGFESVYESSGLALPAPTLIVVHGAATGSLGVFVAAFLPTEPKED